MPSRCTWRWLWRVRPVKATISKVKTTSPPWLIFTFEGSTKGLHFDAVGVFFVVGRPSYLHLTGRVGRITVTTDGVNNVPAVRPGTVLCLCTSKDGVTELEKWTMQVTGGEQLLEELLLLMVWCEETEIGD